MANPRARTWYRITNGADSAEIWLYDEIGKFGVTAQEFVGDLNGIKSQTIDMRVNSPGGEIFDGMAIYSAIRNHPAHVTVHIDGIAASAASFIAMAGDRVLAERTATLMIHDGMGLVAGNSKDMRDLAALLDKCSDNIASIYAERAGGTVDEWRERMRAETWYTAAEAKTAGLVDEVVTGRSGIKNSVEWDLSLFKYQGRAKAPDPFASRLVGEAGPEVLNMPPGGVVHPPPESPPDEAGFLMPALDLGRIRDSVQSLDDIPLSPDLFKAAVALAINDVPAPDEVPPPEPDMEPELFINLPDLRRALREARL